ncbi:phospholipase D-like domain-containing protein [Flavobacterium sp. PLA-1-15]|uniref:phospholipase D-like domain-containing protein n=1 Tax=Flavobacterium sp. PLA-1-15 TaxID=3380533 RepID=UPI003B8150FA
MKTHFLKPGDNKIIIENLSNLFLEDSDLHIAVAYFNSEYFADLIIERAKKKQKTLLILNTSDLIRPKEAGKSEIVISKALIKILKHEGNYIFCKSLGLRVLGNYQNMHHKFIFTKNKLFFGSLNLTDAAINRNFESLLETDNKFLIKDFYSEFGKLWNIGSELYSDRDGKLRSIMCPKCENSDGVDFESFGPICHMCGYNFIVD